MRQAGKPLWHLDSEISKVVAHSLAASLVQYSVADVVHIYPLTRSCHCLKSWDDMPAHA